MKNSKLVVVLCGALSFIGQSFAQFDRDRFDALIQRGELTAIDEYFHYHGTFSSKSVFDVAYAVEHEDALDWLKEQAFEHCHIHMIYRLYERFAYDLYLCKGLPLTREKQELKSKLLKYKLVALKLVNHYLQHLGAVLTQTELNMRAFEDISHVEAVYKERFDAQNIDISGVDLAKVEKEADRRVARHLEKVQPTLTVIDAWLKRRDNKTPVQGITKEMVQDYLYNVHWLRYTVCSTITRGHSRIGFGDAELRRNIGDFEYVAPAFNYEDSDSDEAVVKREAAKAAAQELALIGQSSQSAAHPQVRSFNDLTTGFANLSLSVPAQSSSSSSSSAPAPAPAAVRPASPPVVFVDDATGESAPAPSAPARASGVEEEDTDMPGAVYDDAPASAAASSVAASAPQSSATPKSAKGKKGDQKKTQQ
jgi:hypothetical protein